MPHRHQRIIDIKSCRLHVCVSGTCIFFVLFYLLYKKRRGVAVQVLAPSCPNSWLRFNAQLPQLGGRLLSRIRKLLLLLGAA